MSKNHDLIQQAGIGFGNFADRTENFPKAAEKTPAPASSRILVDASPEAREESLKLIQRLFLTPGQTVPKAVMFAAIDSGSGCSLLCAITARLLAENVSGSVCLVHANFRTPPSPGLFAGENHYGLTDSLRQEGGIRSYAKQAGRDNLWLLSSGSLQDDSLNLLTSERIKERMAELRNEFSFVLIDAPPLNAYADGMAIGRLTDGVVLVLEANATRREAALRVTESLRTAKIPVLGAVLNKRTFPIPAALYKRI